MTVRGWGSSCQTCKKAENSTAAASPTVPRKSAPLGDGVEATPPVHDVRDHLPGPRTRESLLRRLGVEGVQQLGAHLDEKKVPPERFHSPHPRRTSPPHRPGSPGGRSARPVASACGGQRRGHPHGCRRRSARRPRGVRTRRICGRARADTARPAPSAGPRAVPPG